MLRGGGSQECPNYGAGKKLVEQAFFVCIIRYLWILLMPFFVVSSSIKQYFILEENRLS